MHLSVANLQPEQTQRVAVKLTGAAMGNVAGQVLTASTLDATTRFDAPEAVKPVPFTAFEAQGDTLTLTLPAKSVVVLSLN